MTEPVARVLTASITPHKCDNANHPRGCPFGYRLIECPEDEARRWLASISVNDVNVWGSDQLQSMSRESATAALLSRLTEGVVL